jgi:hypothetical protein
MSGELYECVRRRFANELSLWGTGRDMHQVVLATFARERESRPTIEELTLMPTTAQWIPVEDASDLQLVERLLKSGTRFRKDLRYNDSARGPLPRAVLLDTAGPTDYADPTRGQGITIGT